MSGSDVVARVSAPPPPGGAIDAPELQRRLGLRSETLAARILRVLDDDRDGRVPHAELVRKVTALVEGTAADRLRFAFALHDADESGMIEKPELVEMLRIAIGENQLDVSSDMVEALADALVTLADTNGDGKIDVGELERALARHEGMLEHLTSADLRGLGVGPPATRAAAGAGRTARALAWLRSEASWALLLLVYGTVTIGLMVEAALRYRAQGAPLPIQIARACGAALNFHGAIVLLPMCRSLLGGFGRSPLGRFLVDDHVAFHRLVGVTGLWLSVAHTAAHVTNALLGPGLLALVSWAGLTGLVLLVVYLAMAFFAREKVRRSGRFEIFFLTHQLYPIWLGLLLLHGPVAWRWMLAPIVLFALDRFLFRRPLRTRVKGLRVLPSGVTHLRIERPPSFEFQPADYVLVRIPEIARGEWHPFTISSAPERDGEISLHVKATGNWTSRLLALAGAVQRGDPAIEVWIDGPHHAPSVQALRSRRVLFVAAGIGVTPFAAHLESLYERLLAREPVPVDKVHFVWVCRQEGAFAWFSDVLGRLELELGERLDLRIHMDGAREGLGSSVLRAAMDCLYAAVRADLVTGLRARTTFGAPDWDATIAAIAKEHAPEAVDCFYCGPPGLGLVVRAACERHGVPFRQEIF